jgi:hypothetical protein
MAINQPTLRAVPQEQREPQEKKKDWMERLIEGLQIANGITGVVKDVGDIKHNSIRNQAAEDQQNAILSNDQILSATKGGEFEVVQRGPDGKLPEGAMDYKRRGPDGEVIDSPLRRVAKPKAPLGGTWRTVAGPDGKPVERWLPDGSPDQPAYVKPDAPAKPDTLSKVDYGKAAQSAGDKFRDDASKPLMAIDAAGEAENLVKLAETNPAAAAAAVRKLARASGDSGVMSDSDVQAFGGSQAMSDTFARIFERAKSGTMTSDDVKYATEVAQVLKANAESSYGALATDAATRFKANFGGDDDDIYLRITGKQRKRPETGLPPKNGSPKQGAGEAFAAPADAVPGPALSDIDAELAKRGVKPRGASGGY